MPCDNPYNHFCEALKPVHEIGGTPAVSLSGRERQVLQGLARGLTNKQIAEQAEIAATTVRDYVGNLFQKLEAANRTQVVSRAIALGLLQPRN